jgi:hypothetical protein
MWNLLKYLPEIFKQTKARGYLYEIPMNVFRSEMKRTTGVMTDKTVNSWLKYLQELGYIKTHGTGIVELCTDVNKPYHFLSDELDKPDKKEKELKVVKE